MLDKKYFKWVRFDLHHHTTEDKQPSRKNSTPNEWQKILDFCNENDVRLIAITDHNKISLKSYDHFKKYIKQNNYEITVLPGIEMNFKFSKPMKQPKTTKNNYLDINFIFDDNQIDEIIKFWNNFKKQNNITEETRLCYESNYNKICNELRNNNIKYITMLSDNKSSNSRTLLSNEYKNNFQNYPFFDFYEGRETKIRADLNEILEENYGTSKIPFQTQHSDLKKIELPRFKKAFEKLYWYLGEWSFDGLLKIAINWKKRISKEEPPILDKYIENIVIKNYKKPLSLSPGLNVIIGKRGSGKSFLMKKIHDYIQNQNSSINNNSKLKFIQNINFKHPYQIQKEQIFYFKQGEIADVINKLDKEIFHSHKERIQQQLQNKPLSCFLNENCDLSKPIKQIKKDYNQIIINFKELISVKLQQIKKQIKQSYLNKINKFKNQLTKQFNLVNTFDQKINDIDNDLLILSTTIKKLKLKWIQDEVINLISKIKQKKEKEYLNFKKYIQLMKILFEYSQTPLNIESESDTIIFSIESTIDEIISSVASFSKSNNLLMLLIKKEQCLFNKYKKDFQQLEKENSKSLEKNIYFSIKLKIKDHVNFQHFYWPNLLKFDYKINPQNLLTSISQLISLNEKNRKHPNYDYCDFFDIKIDSYVNDEKIEDLSAGERQEKFLKLYFEEKINDKIIKILMFDQPDDNLDSETITKFLIENFIYKKRFSKQIIIVTHDSKIALNADPQRIIFCNFDIQKPNSECYENINTLSLDDKKIYSLLDGKKEFPLQRFKDYGGYYDKKRKK